ncbi:DEAD/DEAH box helicase family protein [Acidobacteriota bacterium]
MAKAVIAYDKDLPEIPDRCAWEKPTSYLEKDIASPTGWKENKSGRRPSRLLLIMKLRAAVDEWRQSGYTGASEVTRRLFEYWFDEDHEVAGFNVPFHYYFCQREAIETLVFLVEIERNRDAEDLIKGYAEVYARDLFTDNIVFQTTMDGRRQIRRYVSELDKEGIQDLPAEELRRYAFKQATGSGKTWDMAMTVVWSYFHKKMESNSELSTNFLIVAPNVIVYQRLEKDFGSNRIFHEIPLIPPEWRGQFSLKAILRGEAAEPDPSGNLFLTNIQQLYEFRDKEWTPQNAVDALLGRKPSKDLASQQRSMLERVKSLKHLVVLNDEAHHVHIEDLAWSQSLLSIHRSLPKGLNLWLDFSATPKDQNGMYFPWTICDYPLAQAVEDRIVKAPLLVTKEDDPKLPTTDPDKISKANIIGKYGYWLQAAVNRWKEHLKAYSKLGLRPVLFIMAEKNVYADAIGEYLWKTKEFGLKESEILVIHTDKAGEVTKKDLDKAREAARDIDKPSSKIKAIVSVMMLREGWDVRNVSIVLGLRPFTAKSEILPEQVIGRGLRRMLGVGPDRTQTLEVLGTRNLLNLVREQLEVEGVGVAVTKSDPVQPIIVQPVKEKLACDIAIPLTRPRLTHNNRKLTELNPDSLEPIYDQKELAKPFRVQIRMEFVTTKTKVHEEEVFYGTLLTPQELLSSITTKVIDLARLPMKFPELYPIVRTYVANRCFGKPVDLDNENIRSHLQRLELQEGISGYLARNISVLTVERREIAFEKKGFRLSDTKPFQWRRNLPALTSKKTVFNYVTSYNAYERAFAEFLDMAADVVRFASLGTTEQGESGTLFRVDYLKPSGAVGFYHPDWAVVQNTSKGEVNWIIETKGRVWEGTEAKDAAIRDWCKRISREIEATWRYCRVNQVDFQSKDWLSFSELTKDVGGSSTIIEG